MRRKGKPRLENERNDAGPVEYEIRSKMGLHVMRPNVEHDKWECVQERKDEEGI